MYLEVRTALRTATKVDLFDGDLFELEGKQWVKENTTVFYLDWQTNALSGPIMLWDESNFVDLYHRMAFGKCGVIVPFKPDEKQDFIFDLVLRVATVEDLKDTPRFIKMNRIYYIYSEKRITGPFFTDNSLTVTMLEEYLTQQKIFVPNERQHFRIKG